jgi:hypothetical protein
VVWVAGCCARAKNEFRLRVFGELNFAPRSPANRYTVLQRYDYALSNGQGLAVVQMGKSLE